MVDFLVGLHAGEEIRLDVVISPADVEVEIGEGVSLKEPFILLGHVLHHCVLSICVTEELPLTLMISLFFLQAI